jgi:hypothetical protein
MSRGQQERFKLQEARSLQHRTRPWRNGRVSCVCLAAKQPAGRVIGSADLLLPACHAGMHPRGVPKVRLLRCCEVVCHAGQRSADALSEAPVDQYGTC